MLGQLAFIIQKMKRSACFLLISLFGISSVAFAQNDKKSEPPVSVLQNRYFLKAMRPELSVFGGTVLNEAYSKTNAVGGRLGLFFTEYLGLEYTFSRFLSQDSNDLEAIREVEYCVDTACKVKQRLEPSFTRLDRAHDIMVSFAPVYGKASIFQDIIVYSDIYGTAGVGQLQTSHGNKITYLLGVGQRFYFAKMFNVRIDAWDHIFKEERENLGQKVMSTKHSWEVSLGFSVFLRGGE